MSADGTPYPTHRDTLARALHEYTDGVNGEGTRGWPERHREVYALAIDELADAIAYKPEARAAVIAATPRDELLAALVALLPHGFCPTGRPHPAHAVDEGSTYWCVGRNTDGHVGADLP